MFVRAQDAVDYCQSVMQHRIEEEQSAKHTVLTDEQFVNISVREANGNNTHPEVHSVGVQMSDPEGRSCVT